MANGIDIYSQYQHVTSWSRVRSAGIDFAYIKLSDGTSTRNEAGYTRGAQSVGIKAGGYHYAQPGNPVAQADLFIDRCEHYGCTDLAPALDLEAPFTPGNAAINFATAFLRQIQKRGHRPCLYGNNAMLRTVQRPVLAAVPHTLIWVARYGASPSLPYDVWQFSDAGHPAGITASAVDLNKGTLPLNSTSAAVPIAPPAPPPIAKDDDAMFLACQGFDPKAPKAPLYALYSGGVLTGLSAESVTNGLKPNKAAWNSVVWITADDMRVLARKSEGVTGGAK